MLLCRWVNRWSFCSPSGEEDGRAEGWEPAQCLGACACSGFCLPPSSNTLSWFLKWVPLLSQTCISHRMLQSMAAPILSETCFPLSKQAFLSGTMWPPCPLGQPLALLTELALTCKLTPSRGQRSREDQELLGEQWIKRGSRAFLAGGFVCCAC